MYVMWPVNWGIYLPIGLMRHVFPFRPTSTINEQIPCLENARRGYTNASRFVRFNIYILLERSRVVHLVIFCIHFQHLNNGRHFHLDLIKCTSHHADISHQSCQINWIKNEPGTVSSHRLTHQNRRSPLTAPWWWREYSITQTVPSRTSISYSFMGVMVPWRCHPTVPHTKPLRRTHRDSPYIVI